MDPNLVYVKTASGEEAILQRTRVMQRNVRMVLILVDGQSSVGDLCGKTGNVQLTESALSELEKGGFVEPRTEHETLWAGNRKSVPTLTDELSDLALVASTRPPLSEPEAPDSRVFVQSLLPLNPRSGASLPPFAFTPMPSLADPPAGDAAEPATAGKDGASGSFARWLKALSPRADRPAPIKVSIKPIRRGPRSSMGWPAIMLLSVFCFVALAALAVVVFPYEAYLPEVQAALSQETGKPVKIASMRVMAYPKPALVLGGVVIADGADEIRIDEMHLQPALETLAAPKKMFRDVALSGVALSGELVPGLDSVLARMARPEAGFGVERMRFEKASVSFKGLGLAGLEGEARLSAAGLLQSLLLHSADRSLSLEAKPEDGHLDVVLEGFGWRPSAGSAFIFDSVNVHGTLDDGVFTISSMDLRIFDGLIQGAAVLQAREKPNLHGSLSFERISANRLGDVLGVGKQFSGETAGKVRFSTTADSWATIFSAVEADGEFAIRRGNVRGIDLAEAMRNVSRSPVQGGITLFEKLSGRIRVTPAGYQFPGLVMTSGLMQSTGQLDVSRELKVNGRMELQMNGSANHRRVPISISGPLKAPSVQAGAG